MALPVTGLRGLGAVGIACGIFWFTGLHAAPVNNDPDATSKSDSPAERVRKALDKTISFKSTSESLADALSQLREQTKINIVLDQTLANQGIPVASPVAIALEHAKVRDVLQAMLSQQGQYNLGYAIVGGMLLVSYENQAVQKQMQQRVSVNFDAVPVKTALQQLARETAVNLILDARVAKDATNPVTLRLNDVPLELTVKLIADMADLKLVHADNVLIVTSEERAAKLRAELGTTVGHPAYGQAMAGRGNRGGMNPIQMMQAMPGGGWGAAVPPPAPAAPVAVPRKR